MEGLTLLLSMVAMRRAMAVEAATETEISVQQLPEATAAVLQPKKPKKELTTAQQQQLERQRSVCCDRHGKRNPLMEAELSKRPELTALPIEMLWEPVGVADDDVQNALCLRHCHTSRAEIENWRQWRRKPGVLEKIVATEQQRCWSGELMQLTGRWHGEWADRPS